MKLLPLLMPRAWRSDSTPAADAVQQFIAEKVLDVVFQPIVSVHDGVIMGHEALVRGPRGNSLETATALMAAAQASRCQRAYEQACAEAAMHHFALNHGHGKLFINVTASSLTRGGEGLIKALVAALKDNRIAPQNAVFELTGYSKSDQSPALLEATQRITAMGAQLALDGLKGSVSHLKAWNVLTPTIVKLDPRLTYNLAHDAAKTKVVKSLVTTAAKRKVMLIAKGVESASDLSTLADMGVAYAQGFFLGSPNSEPADTLNFRASSVITDRALAQRCDIPVFG